MIADTTTLSAVDAQSQMLINTKKAMLEKMARFSHFAASSLLFSIFCATDQPF